MEAEDRKRDAFPMIFICNACALHVKYETDGCVRHLTDPNESRGSMAREIASAIKVSVKVYSGLTLPSTSMQNDTIAQSVVTVANFTRVILHANGRQNGEPCPM